MRTFRWSGAKNERLALERQITFEEIVLAIGTGGLLDVQKHRNPGRYPNQRVLVVAVAGYVYLVPFVEEAESYFLKTIIPSRKATRAYLSNGEPNG